MSIAAVRDGTRNQLQLYEHMSECELGAAKKAGNFRNNAFRFNRLENTHTNRHIINRPVKK